MLSGGFQRRDECRGIGIGLCGDNLPVGPLAQQVGDLGHLDGSFVGDKERLVSVFGHAPDITYQGGNVGLMGTVVLVLAVYVLAVMRLTRLINSDVVLDKLRIAIARRYGPGSTVVYFLGCPWCVGMWLSLAGAVPAVLILAWPWWVVLPLGLACSQLVGMAAPLSADDEIEYQAVEPAP